MRKFEAFKNFDKKKIAFVGNSFTFFGKCVDVKAFDGVDNGYFYQLAKAFGDDVTVTNFTWGGASFWHKGDGFAQRALYEKMKELHPAYYNNPEGLPLDDFYRQDAVVLQQSGDRIEQTYEDARLIMNLFAPATDGNDDSVNVVKVVQNFKGNRALTCNHVFIVKGMNEGVALAVTKLECFLISVIVAAFHEANLRAVSLGRFYLGDRSAVGKADEGFNAVLGCGKCNALRVITCRTSNNAFFLFLVAQHRNLICRASDLKRTRDLQVFGLQI